MCEFEFRSQIDYLIITAASAAVKLLIFIIDQHIAIANTGVAAWRLHRLDYQRRQPRLHHAPPYRPPGGRRFLRPLSCRLTGHSHQRHPDRQWLLASYLHCSVFRHRPYLTLVPCLRVSVG